MLQVPDIHAGSSSQSSVPWNGPKSLVWVPNPGAEQITGRGGEGGEEHGAGHTASFSLPSSPACLPSLLGMGKWHVLNVWGDIGLVAGDRTAGGSHPFDGGRNLLLRKLGFWYLRFFSPSLSWASKSASIRAERARDVCRIKQLTEAVRPILRPQTKNFHLLELESSCTGEDMPCRRQADKQTDP